MVSYVGYDYNAAGRDAALAYLASPGEHDGNVVELCGTVDASFTREITGGFSNCLRQMQSPLRINYSVSKEFMRSRAKEVIVWLASNRYEMDVILAHSDGITIGAVEALEATGGTSGEEVQIYAFGGSEQVLQMQRDGKISSVAHLIDQILQNYIGEEIVRIGELNRQIQSTTFVMVIISFALLAMTGWYARKSYQHVQQAIDEPVEALDKMAAAIAAGDWDARTALPQVEEFRGLARHLNHMASRLEHSVAEQLIAEKKLQKAEMRTLQAQITPHFLYNTLDTIVWLAEAERNQEVMDITMALTSFLRISLSSGQDFIPVSREIEHVKSYLAIQATRYGSTMEYRIEADESLGNMQVLKLLMQPLVENAIYHGVRAKRGRGRIVVSVQRTDKDQMTFSVSDNGIGIEPEKLRALQADLSAGVRPATQSGAFGLFNVSQRIRLYYGTELLITSVYREGTTVSFTISCKEQENVSYISGR